MSAYALNHIDSSGGKNEKDLALFKFLRFSVLGFGPHEHKDSLYPDHPLLALESGK